MTSVPSSRKAGRVLAKIIREIRAEGRKEQATENRRKRAESRRRRFHVVPK